MGRVKREHKGDLPGELYVNSQFLLYLQQDEPNHK